MIETALLSILKNNPAVNAIVGSRVYPMYLPQTVTSACLVYQQVGSSEDYSCDGPEGLVDARFQITCWAPAHATAVNLAAAVKRCLAFYRSSTEGISATRIMGMGDIPNLGEVENVNRYGRFIDVTISYQE